MQRTTSFAADKPIDVQGPATASDSDKPPLADNSTQPENAAKSHKSAKQEKNANGPSKKVAEPEKREPRKKDQPKEPPAEDTVGEPLAPGMMKLLHDEIVTGLNRRGNTDRFAEFQSEAIRTSELLGRQIHRLGVGGQLPLEVVRAHDAQLPDGPGRGRAIHARIAHRRP